jgi:hypothetical protein
MSRTVTGTEFGICERGGGNKKVIATVKAKDASEFHRIIRSNP